MHELSTSSPRRIAALFVHSSSVYHSIDFVDCYDIYRDALTWPGGCPAIAHPPCRTWGKLRSFVRSAPDNEHALGPWAIGQVRKYGGVVEHPEGSGLFRACRCPYPNEFPDIYGGWTLKIDQWRFGHKARKRTILYIVGTQDIPPIPKRHGKPSFWIGSPGASMRSRRPFREGIKPSCPKAEFELTPPEFAAWLVELARSCYV